MYYNIDTNKSWTIFVRPCYIDAGAYVSSN